MFVLSTFSVNMFFQKHQHVDRIISDVLMVSVFGMITVVMETETAMTAQMKTIVVLAD